MQLKIIHKIEIILGSIFILSYFLSIYCDESFALISWLSSLILIVIYCPFGYYTLRSSNVHPLNLIFFGFLFAISVASLSFTLMKIDLFWMTTLIIMLTFVIVAIWRAMAVYIFQYNKILDYNNGISIRFLILFIFMVYVVLSYNLNFQ
jgi:hypothetical protein